PADERGGRAPGLKARAGARGGPRPVCRPGDAAVGPPAGPRAPPRPPPLALDDKLARGPRDRLLPFGRCPGWRRLRHPLAGVSADSRGRAGPGVRAAIRGPPVEEPLAAGSGPGVVPRPPLPRRAGGVLAGGRPAPPGEGL